MSGTVNDVLRIAASQIGYSRWTDPKQGTKYGRWYAQYTGQAWYGNNGVAYCAMFTSWVFNQANVKAAGLPGAYCPTMLNAAKKAGKVLSNKKNAKAGDIVFFDWDGGVVDHVGIVEKNMGSYIQTIEGNTSTGTGGSQDNGGKVARRTRAWGVVAAIVRPDYAAQPVAASSGACGAKTKLQVDGIGGKLTIAELQRYLKGKKLYANIIDGVLSAQSRVSFPHFFPAVTAVTYGGVGGSDTVRGLQRLIGAGVDGFAGKETATKLQQFLNRNGAKLDIDGVFGVKSVRALQAWLNTC